MFPGKSRLAALSRKPVLVGLLAMGVAACDEGSSTTSQVGTGGSPGSGGGPTAATGCPATPSAPVAPNGYYVNGNTICTAEGRAHLLHGVDRPSLEWSGVGQAMSREDFQLMASWKANVVRMGLNQDYWLEGSSLHVPGYKDTVDTAIGWAEQAGMDIILDLHWSDRGTLGSCNNADGRGCQQLMADTNSLEFWTEVATRYQGDGRVMFELYNEPHDITWPVWLHGGLTSQGWQAVGMQDLYDAVRATGANNLVIAGGLNWAYDLTGVPANSITGFNVLYATHPYNNASIRQPSNWQSSWGFLAKTYPVVVTEFGDPSAQCAAAFNQQVIQYADKNNVSWTAWAWFPSGCSFPSIIADWKGTPTVQGEPVKQALLGYDDPPAAPPAMVDAGAGDAAGGEDGASPSPDAAPDGGTESDAGADTATAD